MGIIKINVATKFIKRNNRYHTSRNLKKNPNKL